MKENIRNFEYQNEAGINYNTYNLLLKDDYNLPKEKLGSEKNLKAIVNIDYFTRMSTDNKFAKITNSANKLFYNIDVSKITFDNELKQYIYKDDDLVINFDKLSKYFNDENIIDELTSKKRYNHCHNRSIRMAADLQNSKVVTGYITIGHNKILHSVVEYTYNNHSIILDWTRNLRIEKQQYVNLTNFEEITSIDSKDIENDIKLLLKIVKIDFKVYSVFRNEIMNDLNRNLQIFEQEETKKFVKTK